MEDKYNYKITFEFKDDIDSDELKKVKAEIDDWKEKYHIKQVGDDEYRRIGNNPSMQDDFADVSFFYIILESDYIKYFKKLEYYDMLEEKLDVAV